MTQNFFSLLQIPEAFVIDIEKLEQNYQHIQKKIHPDRFASLAEEVKMDSVIKTAQLNDAYQTLKSPISRAEYLLQLRGINLHDDQSTTIPQEFLIQQMEWSEELEENKSNKFHLEKLLKDVAAKKNDLINLLPEYFNQITNHSEAMKITRELNFIEKIEQRIHDALIEIH